MSTIDPHIFRAYDIRGTVPEQITPEVCRIIGQAYGTELRSLYGLDHPRVVVGRDARTHGPEMMEAVVEGLMAAGCAVVEIGQTPSPMNYFAICAEGFDGGVQITASHNPSQYSGLKLQVREAVSFSGDDLQRLLLRIQNEEFSEGEGSRESLDILPSYLEKLSEIFSNLRNMKVVVDYGNGIAGPAYTQCLESLGCEVIALYKEPDGTFPNHPADPSQLDTLKELQSKVLEVEADIGLAFDGDGDRLGVVDEQGVIRSPDEVLLLLAKDHLSRNSKGTVVFTVSNSSILDTEVRKLGGTPVMCTVGHSYVEHMMEKEGSLLGGEQSGHFFCAESYYLYDDAIVTALRLISILDHEGHSLSSLLETFPKVFQAPERRPQCSDDKKTEIIERVKEHFIADYPVNTLDGARIDFGDGAWAGIRQSNTSPCISICAEARTPEKLKEVEEIVLGHLGGYEEVTF